MEYTINAVARLAGVSTKTLRHYDKIGLLAPFRINDSGYRIYTQAEIDFLQQILFYKALDFSLEEIKEIMSSDSFNEIRSLKNQKKHLLKKKEFYENLIISLDKTILSKEGGKPMSNKEKFKDFKRDLMDKNEKEYGDEVRKLYGKETADKSNEAFMNMPKAVFDKTEELSQIILSTLKEAGENGDPDGSLAKTLANSHKEWLKIMWGKNTPYSKEAQLGLCDMYLADERFLNYYGGLKNTQFLKEAVEKYL